MNYNDLVKSLAGRHGVITISERHLISLLKMPELKSRSKAEVTDLVFFFFFNQAYGFRWMYSKCLENRFCPSQKEKPHVLILATRDPDSSTSHHPGE